MYLLVLTSSVTKTMQTYKKEIQTMNSQMSNCKGDPPLKPNVPTPEPGPDATFDQIFEYWQVLTRCGESLAFPLIGRFVKPGGFFKWFFYWDSYFTLLGLVVQGNWQLAREIVEGLLAEVEAIGFVPNRAGR